VAKSTQIDTIDLPGHKSNPDGWQFCLGLNKADDFDVPHDKGARMGDNEYHKEAA